MAKKQILNSSQTRLVLFESGIKMDETLPKHKEYNEYMEKKKLLEKYKRIVHPQDMLQEDIDRLEMEIQAMENLNALPPVLVQNGVGMDDTLLPKLGVPDYETLKKMFLDNTSLDDCKITITKYMKEIMEKHRWSVPNSFVTPSAENSLIVMSSTDPRETSKKDNFWTRMKKLFANEEKVEEVVEPEPEIEFDVVAFFNRVKLETEESTQSYANRLKELVECIGYCDITGQVALKEQIFEQLTVNKYESVLWANGMYKAVSEEKIVEFTKGSDKGLSLDYMANFSRVIPSDVVKKKIEADKLGVFDNYVILHYDPEAKSYVQTEEEKRKEIERRKDPILFGVIMGSDKLYYIGDWIDDYCDLTFEALTDKLGKDIIEQDFIKEHIKF